jgi:hemerythrin superfamily protein
MNAIDMLKQQHRAVEALFKKLEHSDGDDKESLFLQIADALAIHAAIEERHFYPAVRERHTDDLVLSSLDEHRAIKRALAELLRTESTDEAFDAKCKQLEEAVEQHVGEEEEDLFPRAEKLLGPRLLASIAEQMAATRAELLAEGEPRLDVLDETGAPI